jgi:hypothetical protein
MLAAQRFSLLAVLAAAVVATGAGSAQATKARVAAPQAHQAAKGAIAHRVYWKRSHHKRRHSKRWAKRHHHAKRWRGASDYGVTYVRPKPFAYIYRYQPYVYHRPRVYIRPIPRSAHRRRYWPRKVWRRRYDRRPGVYYHRR